MELKSAGNYFLNVEDIARYKRKATGGLVWGIIFLVVGVPALLLYGLGLFLIIVGIAFLISGSNYKKRSKDTVLSGSEYDLLVQELISEKGGNIIEKVGLDSSEVQLIKPICIICYNFSESSKYKVGEDGIPRSNVMDKMVIFFTEKEIHYFKLSCNTISGESREVTKMWFYKDIMSIETSNGNKIFDRDTVNFLEVIITLTNGKEERFVLSGKNINEFKESIEAMRYLIKEHRD